MSVKITDSDVKHCAKLAAIEITDDQVPKVAEQLGKIFNYIEVLSEVQTRGVVPTSHVHGSVNCFRDDVVKPSFDTEKLAQNAPEFENGFYMVPKII